MMSEENPEYSRENEDYKQKLKLELHELLGQKDKEQRNLSLQYSNLPSTNSEVSPLMDKEEIIHQLQESEKNFKLQLEDLFTKLISSDTADVQRAQNTERRPTTIDEAVSVVAFSDSKNRMASAKYTVKIWNLSTFESLCETEAFECRVISLSFNKKGRYLACGSLDGSIQVLKTSNLQPLHKHLCGHFGAVLSIEFGKNKYSIASGSVDRTVVLWKKQTVLCKLTGHQGSVHCVTVNYQKQIVCSASSDSTLRLWSIPFQECIHKIRINHPLSRALWTPDGEDIVFLEKDLQNNYLVKSMNVESETTTSIRYENDKEILSLQIFRDHFVAVTSDRVIKIWKFDSSILIGSFSVPYTENANVFISNEGKHVAFAGKSLFVYPISY